MTPNAARSLTYEDDHDEDHNDSTRRLLRNSDPSLIQRKRILLNDLIASPSSEDVIALTREELDALLCPISSFRVLITFDPHKRAFLHIRERVYLDDDDPSTSPHDIVSLDQVIAYLNAWNKADLVRTELMKIIIETDSFQSVGPEHVWSLSPRMLLFQIPLGIERVDV